MNNLPRCIYPTQPFHVNRHYFDVAFRLYVVTARIFCRQGMKIEMMRKNPDVCFQVDAIDDLLNWESVICWGKFEELVDIDEKTQAMQKIINWVMPLMTGETAQPSHGFTDDTSNIGDDVELILYKIVLNKKTGRFEKS